MGMTPKLYNLTVGRISSRCAVKRCSFGNKTSPRSQSSPAAVTTPCARLVSTHFDAILVLDQRLSKIGYGVNKEIRDAVVWTPVC